MKKWQIIGFITTFVLFKECLKNSISQESFGITNALITVGLTIFILIPFYLLKEKQMGYVLIFSACYTIFSAYQMFNLGINIAINALLMIDFVFLFLYAKLGDDIK
jgi:hypothetical protein